MFIYMFADSSIYYSNSNPTAEDLHRIKMEELVVLFVDFKRKTVSCMTHHEQLMHIPKCEIDCDLVPMHLPN